MSEQRNIEQALAWVRRGFLALPPELSEDGLDALDRAKEIRACFTQYPGALQTILDMTLNRPPVDYRLPADQAASYALLRQGQNTIAAAILKYILDAETEGKTDENLAADFFGDPGNGRRGRRGRSGGLDGDGGGTGLLGIDSPGVALR